MSTTHLVSIIMVILGTALVLWAVTGSLRLYRQVPDELKNRWLFLTGLIFFFLFGYLGFVVILITKFGIPLELWSSVIMLAGAIFVLVFVKLSEKTIIKAKESLLEKGKANEELIKVNRVLQDEVNEKEKISEKLRSSKAYLENIFNSSIPLCITSYDHIVIEANDAYRNIFGELADIGQTKCFDSRPGPSCKTPNCPMAKISDGAAEVTCESVKVEPDGTRHHFLVTARPFIDQDGQVAGIIESFQDITELKKAEAALGQEMARTQKLESVGLLAGGIAHDFNNILTAIVNNLVLAKMAPEEGKLLKRIESSERAVMKAKQLTGQLLTFAKGGAPIKKFLPVDGMLKDAVEFALHGSNVKCEFDIADGLWAADYDIGQIQQAVSNLVINADQAMENGGLLKVKAENLMVGEDHEGFLGPGKYVKISFQDEGYGIAEQDIPKLFDPYFTTKPSGTGLGLAMVYSIVSRHGGHIEVDSEEGKGSLFTMLLPARELKPEMESVDMPVEKENAGTPVAAGKRILVMDDDDEIRELIREFLEADGFVVERAADGETAVKKYDESFSAGTGFDCLVMDLTVPGGMGGKEALDLIKKIDPDVQAIVSSGYSNDPVMADHKRHGFVEIAVKPYKAGDLIGKINQVISAA